MPMSEGNVTSLLEGILGPLTQCLDAESARRVAEYRIAPAIQTRVDQLAERANDGLLNDDERSEYEALINATDFIAILKLKAQRQLEASVR